MATKLFPPNALRVELSTSKKANSRIYEQTEERVSRFANSNSQAISSHIKELDREWDTERILEANASAFILISGTFGLLFSNWWFVLTGLVAFYLLQHAVQGWCPPLPILRKLGIRTMPEISAEKTALKVMRGDFDNIKSNPREVLKAAVK
jgi:hypothetical protein